jgi:ribosomal protein S18 acetylase RimI-like enzyme
MQPVSPQLLEYGVFSKPQFDPEGLILATRDDLPVGFVHGGFAPNESGTAIDTSLGTTHMLMLQGTLQEGMSAGLSDGEALADDLLAASEQYLRDRGAKVLYGGGIRPLNSFYQGLYGGSEIPGVLHTDRVLTATCARNRYCEIDRVVILQCDLARFRPPFSRRVRQIKRTAQWVESVDPHTTSWWDACLWSGLQRDHFELVDKALGKVIARVSFWDVQPLSSSWGLSTAGLIDLFVEYDWRRQGCASHLLREAFRLLRRRGVSTVEVQTMASNEAALAFYRKLGFTEVDHGLVFRKEGQEATSQQ